MLAADEGAARDLADLPRHRRRRRPAPVLALVALSASAWDCHELHPMSSKQSETRADARHAARLAAVQALYQMEMSGGGRRGSGAGIRRASFRANCRRARRGIFLRHPHRRAAAPGGDRPRHRRRLSQNWKLERVDSILRAILRCAVFELVARRDVPAKVVIDEYVAVAGAFFGGDEPGFVNAALDTIARRKRAPNSACRLPKANWISESPRNSCRSVAKPAGPKRAALCSVRRNAVFLAVANQFFLYAGRLPVQSRHIKIPQGERSPWT